MENVKHAIDITNKDKLSKKVKIMKTPAGKGSQIGTTLEEFQDYGICFQIIYK